jgi:hypothetical protein
MSPVDGSDPGASFSRQRQGQQQVLCPWAPEFIPNGSGSGVRMGK